MYKIDNVWKPRFPSEFGNRRFKLIPMRVFYFLRTLVLVSLKDTARIRALISFSFLYTSKGAIFLLFAQKGAVNFRIGYGIFSV